MIDAPPFDPGAMNDTDNVVSPGVTFVSAGGSGVVRGVAWTLADAAPGPAVVTARNLTEYVVPLVKPVRTSGEAADAGLRAIHRPSPLEVTRYW